MIKCRYQSKVFPNIEFKEREDNEDEDEGRDMKLKFRMIYLYFHYKGKKYVMRLDDRIKTIGAYVFTKNYFKPALAGSRGLRYKTLEEQTHDDYIEMDLYYYTKVVADGISRDLMSYEEGIWQPGLIFRLDRETHYSYWLTIGVA
jgi:hypothetical protein